MRTLIVPRAPRHNKEMLTLLHHIERELELLTKAIQLLQQALKQDAEDAA